MEPVSTDKASPSAALTKSFTEGHVLISTIVSFKWEPKSWPSILKNGFYFEVFYVISVIFLNLEVEDRTCRCRVRGDAWLSFGFIFIFIFIIILFFRQLLWSKLQQNPDSHSFVIRYDFEGTESDKKKYWLVKNRWKLPNMPTSEHQTRASCSHLEPGQVSKGLLLLHWPENHHTGPHTVMAQVSQGYWHCVSSVTKLNSELFPLILKHTYLERHLPFLYPTLTVHVRGSFDSRVEVMCRFRLNNRNACLSHSFCCAHVTSRVFAGGDNPALAHTSV